MHAHEKLNIYHTDESSRQNDKIKSNKRAKEVAHETKKKMKNKNNFLSEIVYVEGEST